MGAPQDPGDGTSDPKSPLFFFTLPALSNEASIDNTILVDKLRTLAPPGGFSHGSNLLELYSWARSHAGSRIIVDTRLTNDPFAKQFIGNVRRALTESHQLYVLSHENSLMRNNVQESVRVLRPSDVLGDPHGWVVSDAVDENIHAVIAITSHGDRRKALETFKAKGISAYATSNLGEASAYIMRKPSQVGIVLVETPRGMDLIDSLRAIQYQGTIVTYIKPHSQKGVQPDTKLLVWLRDHRKRLAERGVTLHVDWPLSRTTLAADLESIIAEHRNTSLESSGAGDVEENVFANNIYLFRGPSGSGKTELTTRLARYFKGQSCAPIKTTSRPKRGEEVEGKDAIFLTRRVIEENQRKGLYFWVKEFPKEGCGPRHLYAWDYTAVESYRNGSDVYLSTHANDDISDIEAQFAGNIVTVMLVAKESELSDRVGRRSQSARQQEGRDRENIRELQYMQANKHWDYLLNTDPQIARDGSAIESPDESINFSLQRLINIVNWERQPRKGRFLDTLLRRLVGQDPQRFKDRVSHGDRLYVKFSEQVMDGYAQRQDIVDSEFLKRFERVRILACESDQNKMSLMLQAPGTSFERRALQELVAYSLSPLVQPVYNTSGDMGRLLGGILVGDAHASTCDGLLHYRLSDDLDQKMNWGSPNAGQLTVVLSGKPRKY